MWGIKTQGPESLGWGPVPSTVTSYFYDSEQFFSASVSSSVKWESGQGMFRGRRVRRAPRTSGHRAPEMGHPGRTPAGHGEAPHSPLHGDVLSAHSLGGQAEAWWVSRLPPPMSPSARAPQPNSTDATRTVDEFPRSEAGGQGQDAAAPCALGGERSEFPASSSEGANPAAQGPTRVASSDLSPPYRFQLHISPHGVGTSMEGFGGAQVSSP